VATLLALMSLSTFLGSYLNTPMILESLGLISWETFSETTQEYASCLYDRGAEEGVAYGFEVASSRVTASGSNTTAANARRRTQEQAAGASNLKHWDGYKLPADGPATSYTVTSLTLPTRRRMLVESVGGGYVLGGLLLHQVRRPFEFAPNDTARCGPGYAQGNPTSDNTRRFSALDRLCGRRSAVFSREAGTAQLSGTYLGPIGVEPVFTPQSAMYNPELAEGDSAWYNTTEGSEDLNVNGAARPFTHTPMPSFPDGYPIFLSNSLSEARTGEVLQYLQDGQYLSATQTHSLTAEMVGACGYDCEA
jgi:hypothetical protein